MSRSRHARLAAFLAAAAFLAGRPLPAQDFPTDRPARVPAVTPSKAERDRAEAATLYGLGSLHEGKQRLLEALRCYEGACKLDPDAAAPRRALVPLYLALDRIEDALATARRVLELDPDDWETATVYARQLRSQNKSKEAAAVLRRATESQRLKEKADAYAQTWSDLAQMEEETGAWDQAATSYRKLAELLDHPAALVDLGSLTAAEAAARSAEAYESLGRVLLRAGDATKAIAAFETARARDPARSGRLALHLAEIHDRAGRPREALARLDEYLAGRPAGVEGYEMKVRLLRQLGEADRVVSALRTASAADPHNTSLSLLFARELRRAGRTADAEVVYHQLIAAGANAEVYRGLFGLFKEEGAPGGDRALALLNQTIRDVELRKKAGATAPGLSDRADEQAANGRAMLAALRDDAESVKQLLRAARRQMSRPGQHRLDGETLFLLAELAERARQFDAAEELYRGCLAAGPTPVEEMELYQGLLSVLRAAHKYEAVIEVCKEGLETARNTNRIIFFGELAVARAALGQYKEALEAADEAEKLAQDEQRRVAYGLRRAAILSRAGKHAEAVAACRGLLAAYNQPKKDEGPLARGKREALVQGIRLELSQVHNAAGEHEKSDEQLRLILEADPDDVTANNNLGYQWAERGVNLQEAERLIRKAIDLDRHQRGTGASLSATADQPTAAYVDSLGWVLFRKGDLKGARAELQKATTLPDGNDDPVVFDHLGDVLFRTGEKGEAATAWRKALELFDAGTRPKDERYQEIQQKLRQTAP
jgi:tetratricopeptide (TPR) repeat protein